MPPSSNMRKTAGASNGLHNTAANRAQDAGAAPRRTASGRTVRVNTTRPANYYARPSGPQAAQTHSESHDAEPPGFFPALQFFSDAITALPREVMRQMTLTKEVEAKIHGPNEMLGGIVDRIMRYTVPPKKSAPGGNVTSGQGLLSITAHNSAGGSASASLINGVAPHASLSGQNSATCSIDGDDATAAESADDLAKRHTCQELCRVAHKLLPNLDEKNAVLAEVNRVLSQQLARIDSVMPHVEGEISEEARLGSMTHWAYSDNRQKKQAPANRRDMAAANSLAAAANAARETEIAQSRRDNGREPNSSKLKGRAKEQLDSDFDDKPKKSHAKSGKVKTAGTAGLGISTGVEANKKRKADKELVAPAMERSASGRTKVPKVAKEAPKSMLSAETHKKVAKARPAPLPSKRKVATSTNASPALANSPLHTSFTAAMEPQSGRPQPARLRQNSAATNLRHEQVTQEAPAEMPVPSKPNGAKGNGKRKAPHDEREYAEGEERAAAQNTTETAVVQQEEDAHMVDNDRQNPSRSTSNSGKAGRGSKTGTPQMEGLSDMSPMVRPRSTRSVRGGNEDSSSEPQTGSRHQRSHSNSHLVKQLAPFNRSPELDPRHSGEPDEDGNTTEGVTQKVADDADDGQQSPMKRKPSTRRNTLTQIAPEPPLVPEESRDEPLAPEAEVPQRPAVAETTSALSRSVTPNYEEDSDPNEPKYCYCNHGSYGSMVGCDNEKCKREWFHIACTDLREIPSQHDKWYCDECRPLFSGPSARKARGGRAGRGR